jgi:asparagine synthase (glutamine-hydrolysing)
MTSHSVVPAPYTIVSGIRKLPPATVRVVEPDGSHADQLYWDPQFCRDPGRADWSEQNWQHALLASLRTVVDRRMVADVPVGVLLSGGIDSALGGGPAGRGRTARPADLQHRLRFGRR